MTEVEERGLFIGGEFVPSHSGATFPVHNPHNDEIFSKVAEAGEADAEAAIDAAREAFDGPWVALAPEDRGKLLPEVARMVQKAGFPAGAVNVVPGKGSVVGAALARHRGVDKICFTGSVEVGQKILEAAAANLKKPLLELGGKGPNLIFEDADVEAAVQGSLFAAYHNQGQACIAGSRIYVHTSIWDAFLRRFTERVRSIRIGNPLEETTQMGPLTSKDHQKRVLNYVEVAKGEGAEIPFGGRT